MSSIVVCGGSVIGLTAAMLLANEGHDVVVLENDPTPPPADPAAAWEGWDRTGVPQFHQPHNLFPRAKQVLDAELPAVAAALEAGGGAMLDMVANLPPSIADRDPRPGDERFRFVTGRRPYIEAVYANAAIAHPGVTVERGVKVRGLLTGEGPQDCPRIVGVVLEDGAERRADLVVDAMGRRSPLAGWLASLGAPEIPLESQDRGFAYYTRYYRGPEPPALMGPMMAALGSISVLTLVGDNGTWGVTITGSSNDRVLHGLKDSDRFTAVLQTCPLHAHWTQGEPITDVLPMAGVVDKLRHYVVDDRPAATGVVAVGDAWACTNPSAGRGISVGHVHSQCLRDAVREGVEDLDALALRFDALTEREATPFFRVQMDVDAARIAEMDAAREGREPPPRDDRSRAMAVALGQDPDVFRAAMDMVTCLALPDEVFARPGLLDKVMAFAGQDPLEIPGPDRSQLVALLA